MFVNYGNNSDFFQKYKVDVQKFHKISFMKILFRNL